jgi:hypothetical protein
VGFLSYLFYPWSLILQVLAIVHFIRRRPDTYWIYIIVFLGPLGALIYLLVEGLPDIGMLSPTFRAAPRRRRIAELEAIVRENASAANYEELGDLLMDEGNLASARTAFDKAIAARSDTQDSFYRRGLCALKLGDAAAAIPDLEQVFRKEPGFDFHRAGGMLALAYAQAGRKEEAEKLFRHMTTVSTLSETYLNFAEMLASEGRIDEARQWAQKVLDKKLTMPAYLRRRERHWFRNANEMLKRLSSPPPTKQT